MRIKLLILTAIFLCSNTFAIAIEDSPIKENETLSLEDCVGLAINNSPIIRKKEYNMEIAKSNVGIAKSAYFPVLGEDVGIYQLYNSNKNVDGGSSSRNLPSASVYLSQLIWNFGKTSSLIKVEKFYRLAAEYEFMDSICDTIFDVKIKYYNVLKTRAIFEVQYNNLLICEKNYWRAKQFYESGKKPKIDFVNAEVFLTDAIMKLTDAQNAYELALADLANSMYIAYAPDFNVKYLKTFNFYDSYTPDVLYDKSQFISQDKADKKHEKNLKNISFKGIVEKNGAENTSESEFLKLPFTWHQSYDLAYKNSPDLWVLDTTLDAMKETVVYIKREYYPDITGNVGYGFNNTRTLTNNSFTMSVNMNTAVNFKQLKHEIDRANDQVQLASSDVELFKQNLYFEVKKCLLNVRKSENQVTNVREKVNEAMENYVLADQRYDRMENNYIALQQARTNYNDTKILYINTIYDYNLSLANLEIAMHYHLDDLHHKAHHALKYHYREIFNKLEEALHCEYINQEEHSHKNEDDNL